MVDFLVRVFTLLALSAYCRVFRFHLVRVTPEYLDSLCRSDPMAVCAQISNTARKGRVVIVWCE